MKKTQNPAPAVRSVRALVVGAVALAGVGCAESSVMLPDVGSPDAIIQADAGTLDSGVPDAMAAADAASVDAAIATADAVSIDATAWEEDAGPDTNPYLRG